MPRRDPLEALAAARAAGLKATLIVPDPVRCPTIAPPRGDLARLTATGALASFAIDIDGFLRADVGVAEAVALLGPPVLCSGAPDAGFMNLYLAPRAGHVVQANLETHDGELIGVVVEIDPPVEVDLTALTARHGPARTLPSLHGPASDALAPASAAYRGQVILAHRDHADPLTRRRVHQIIYRRTAVAR